MTNTYDNSLKFFGRIALPAALVMLAGCATEPRPYSIAGTWDGSAVAQGSLHLELTDVDGTVSGTGRLTRTGAQSIDFTVAGTLRDSSLESFSGVAHLAATFRLEESRANAFVAHFDQGTATFDGTVSRR